MGNNFPDIVAIAIPVFMVLIGTEMVWASHRSKDTYHPDDLALCLLLGLTAFAAGLIVAGPVAAICSFVMQFRLPGFNFAWWVWLLCILADDFLHYALHRSSHRIRILWASHVVHHSSQHFNLAVGLRQSFSITFLSALAFRIPLIIAGFPVEMVAFVITGNQIYQFWTHCGAIGKCPRWIEYIFTTPSHHRVHHAVNAEYLDRNFAGVFIIWDRMLGTFKAEDPAIVPRYGIVRQLGRYQLLICIFHEWVAIANDVWAMPWGSKLGYMFAPPGWSHDGSRQTTDAIRAQQHRTLELCAHRQAQSRHAA
jgi:sterol desaturase/sphingolipid hydroxylase (fatty acid hydroxylase superfamily)